MPETKANAITAQTNQISDTPVDAWPYGVYRGVSLSARPLLL